MAADDMTVGSTPTRSDAAKWSTSTTRPMCRWSGPPARRSSGCTLPATSSSSRRLNNSSRVANHLSQARAGARRIPDAAILVARGQVSDDGIVSGAAGDPDAVRLILVRVTDRIVGDRGLPRRVADLDAGRSVALTGP